MRKFSAAVAAAALALFAAEAPAAPVKIGVILTLSGPESEAGVEMQRGIELYVKQHEKELPPGVSVQLVVRDDTGPLPDVAKRLAQELITREHVQLLTGFGFSPNTAAVAPLTAQAKVPLVIMNAAGVAIPRLSPYLVRTSFTLWQISLPMGQWAAKNGCHTAYVATSDFIPGHDAEAAFTKGFTENGGTVVATARFPLTSPDYVPVVARIKDKKPDCAFVFTPAGKQATAFIKAWSNLGLAKVGVRLVTTQDLMLDDELPNMGETPVGVVSAGNYSVAAVRPQNRAFVAAWRAAYGADAIPDFLSVGAYDGMAAIFDMLTATKGEFTADQAMEFFKNWRGPESPRGPIRIDPATRDIIQNIYIRRVEKQADGKLANIEFATIPMQKDPWKELNPAK